MSRTKWLVTGGAGFIGSNIAGRLAASGERVRILDDLSTGRWWLVDRLVKDASLVEKVEGDIRDPRAVAAAMEGVEVVFHEAALGSVPRSIEEPREADAINVNGTVTVLDAARRAGVRRVVFAASSAAYGDSPELPKMEDMAPRPLSPYAVSKVACEAYVRVFAELYGIDTVNLRYFNVFGPNQLPSGPYAAAIPRFVWAALRDQPITIYGDGEQTRDFCFIDNVVDVNLLAANAPGRVAGGIFNVAGGVRITLNELVAEIGRALGKPLNVRHVDPRAGDIRHSLADISRARSGLGFEPRVAWQGGIAPTIAFLRELAAHEARTFRMRSMTGFGIGEAPLAAGRVVAEIRGVNGRFLDVRVRLPREILDHSMFVEQLVRERLSRGRYEVGVRAEGSITGPPRIDRARARALLAEMVALRDEVAPGEGIPLGTLLAHPEVLGVDADSDASEVRAALRRAAEGALSGLAETCAREGDALAADLATRIDRVEAAVREIADRAPGAIETQRRRVGERLARLLEGEGAGVEPWRIEQEVALLVIRADVAEETTRLAIHLAQMREWLRAEEPVGRRLDFLLQEMVREINTVGSKSQDAAIARAVIDVKAELERMREQVQNVE